MIVGEAAENAEGGPRAVLQLTSYHALVECHSGQPREAAQKEGRGLPEPWCQPSCCRVWRERLE